MPVPEHVKGAAMLAKGRGIRVEGPDGVHRIGSRAESDAADDDIAERAAKLLEVDSQIRATLAMMAALAQSMNVMMERFESSLQENQAALDRVAARQEVMIEAMQNVETALYEPVMPLFHEDGRIKSAHRIRGGNSNGTG